ncbi:hypothetical protein HA402_010971 [Bradysia odoriphaga]|nr:hypothetical protein HA402_010971 [Bradysia odoriphaga]
MATTTNNNDAELDKIEEILKGVFKSKESPSVESNGRFDSVVFGHNDLHEMNDKCDVINFTNDIPSMKEDVQVRTTGDPKRRYTTPDILIKSNSCEEHIDFTTEINERPDILKNVFASDASDGDQMLANEKCDEIHDQIDKCELGQWSITPIDIVGNFEQEVEREFGLIVSGYKSSSSDDEMCVSVKSQVDEISRDQASSMYEKMTDAVLSNAKETINTTIGECAHDQLKLNSENCSANDVADAHPHEKISCAERQRIVIKSSTHSIPTAIVKPKYQRTSYDDRQLPAVVSIDREKPWYDNCNVNNNVTLTPNRKIQQLPHFERKHKKHRAGHRTNGGLVSDKEKFNSILLCEKDMDSASVAVVPPRKKDKIEQVDVYGNGDKGIKCSTMQKNHSNMSNNNNSINCSNNNNNNVVYRKGNTDGVVKDNSAKESLASFDVYNIETALPVIDLEAIENHLKAAKEEERRKRNDREEIRRRLAMGSDYDYFGRTHSDRPTRKPSLHSRLQGGMNLQICFMNETASDNESPSSDSESCPKLSKSFTFSNNSTTGNTYSRYNSADSHPYNTRPLSVRKSSSTEKASRPSSLPIGPKIGDDGTKDVDFFTKQARLQIEARMALAQAKDMAHMQMEIDRQKQKQSPITEIIRNSLEKVGITFPEEKRRVSRLMLTDMNIAQLQVIVNEFHTQIERLNENLVQFLMERDDLHMSQDSMLVDIEDLTRYLLAKEQTTDKQNNQPAILTTPTQEIVTKDHIVKTTNRPQTQSKLLRITNLVKK